MGCSREKARGADGREKAGGRRVDPEGIKVSKKRWDFKLKKMEGKKSRDADVIHYQKKPNSITLISLYR